MFKPLGLRKSGGATVLYYDVNVIRTVDLNADAGEAFGRWRVADEHALFPYLTSVNLACGFHAGDPLTMQRSVGRAKRYGVQVGAHPGFPDLVGFGRRDLGASPEEIYADVLYQLGALAAFLGAEGLPMHHVKAHGALYFKMMREPETACAVAEAVATFDATLPLVVLAGAGGQTMQAQAAELGLRVVAEAFPDRAYLADGRLAPRTERWARRGRGGYPLSARRPPAGRAKRRGCAPRPDRSGDRRARFLVLLGFYLRFGDRLERDTNAALHRLADTLRADPLGGVTDIVPGYTTLYLEYDARALSEASVRRWAERRADAVARADARTIEIPVRYDGIDLEAIREQTGLTHEEVVKRHSGSPYHVYAVGFTPGFPFMAEVDEAIRLPRRETPRAVVDAHSVAMTGRQTGIYPLPSPGGWHLLGTALETVYDPHRAEPFLLRAGDQLSFVAAQGETPPPPGRLELLPPDPHTPLFRVHEPGLLDLVVDQGRFLAGHFGLSRSGPVDAPLAGLANRLLTNPPDAPLLELTLTGPVLEALTASVVAVTGWSLRPYLNGDAQTPFSSFVVKKGDVLTFTPTATGCRSYLAVAGGLESGRFWSSASVDLKGFIGRPLRAGDVLGRVPSPDPRPERCFVPYRQFGEVTTLRLQPGPQASREVLEALAEHPFTVASADRMGVRFEGTPVTGSDVLSEATPLGAVQVTSGGAPILLLHDRGSLGGYAKPGLLHPADLARAAQLRPGGQVRFVVGAFWNG